MECSVSPFLAQYEATHHVRICSGATAFTSKIGETIILIFGQGLCFGDMMSKSLINPNQCRAYGVSVCDDPTDPHRDLGFFHDNEFFPLFMRGTTAMINTRCPTDLELHECRKFYLSDPDKWDPENVEFQTLRHVNTIDTKGHSPVTVLPPYTDLSSSHLQFRQVNSLTLSKFGGKNVITKDRHHEVTLELLSRKWACGLGTATNTLKATTQLGVRSAIGPLTRRYRTDILQLHYRRLNFTLFSDTMFAKTKSLKGFTCCQVYADGEGFVWADPMKSKSEAGRTLKRLIQDVGIPNKIVSDGAPEQIGPGSEFQKLMRTYDIRGHQNEAKTQKYNRAEDAIRECKRRWKQRIIRRRVPKRVWDFGIVWESEILLRMCRHGNDFTGMERVTGDTPDISEWLDFEFYDICQYWDVPNDWNNPKIGRWLGVSHRVGSAMCYWILTETGSVIAWTTVQHIMVDESKQEETIQRINDYQSRLDDKLGDDQYIDSSEDFTAFINEDIPDDDEDPDSMGQVIPEEEPYQGYHLPEIDEIGKMEDEASSENVFDTYIGAEVSLPGPGGRNQMARVVKRIKGNDGKPKGVHHDNPILNTSEYLVEFPDGVTKELTANIIAESMFSQVDTEGHHYQLLSEISEHCKDSTAIPKSDGFYSKGANHEVPKKTTRGWELLVHWKDRSSNWVPLKDLKVSNPVELAEYAVANDIHTEPAFNWWVRHTLKKRDRIISKVKSKYWRTTHVFGIRVPRSVEEALKLDEENGNTLWYDAIQKEMKNVRIAFEADDIVTPEQARSNKHYVGFQEIKCHMSFDIKMDGKFIRKARFVVGGHTTDPPASITYSSVVARDTVRIAFTIAALNGLDVMSCDIGNAYLNAPCQEKIWCIAGPEFGSDKGKVMKIVQALYGLKTSGASWRAMFASTLSDLGYFSSKADPDLWMKPKTKPNGDQYYSMVLVYVDDVLHFDHEPSILMDELEFSYRLKDKADAPDRYLGANIDKVQLSDGSEAWSMSSYEYLSNAIKDLEEQLEKDGSSPLKTYGKRSGERPFPVDYRPEIDITPELGDELTTRYLQLIGILRWSIELGRIDIITEVSVLSQHQCNPREGHLDAVYRIFWFLKCSLKKGQQGRIVFDHVSPEVDESLFNEVDQQYWNDFYPGAEEVLPHNMPEPRGRPVDLSCYVDADHAGNLMTRRSHTGILLYLNNTPIIW